MAVDYNKPPCLRAEHSLWGEYCHCAVMSLQGVGGERVPSKN